MLEVGFTTPELVAGHLSPSTQFLVPRTPHWASRSSLPSGRDKTDQGRQPVCHRVVTDGGERSKDGKRSAECGMVPPWAGLTGQVVQDPSSGSLGAKTRMLEMNLAG